MPKHDIKINIRRKSILEGIHINLQILYFIIFHCFVENKSLNETLGETEEFAKQLGICGITKAILSNVYGILRNKIRLSTHNLWSKSFLGQTINTYGYASVEIDESKIISNGNETFWKFGMISRETKEASVYCVLNDRTKNNLLAIIKKNIITYDEEDEDLSEINSIKTRIYSDSYSSYQPNDFKNAGYQFLYEIKFKKSLILI